MNKLIWINWIFLSIYILLLKVDQSVLELSSSDSWLVSLGYKYEVTQRPYSLIYTSTWERWESQGMTVKKPENQPLGQYFKKFKATVTNLTGRGPMYIIPPHTTRRMIREEKKSSRIAVGELQRKVASWGHSISKTTIRPSLSCQQIIWKACHEIPRHFKYNLPAPARKLKLGHCWIFQQDIDLKHGLLNTKIPASAMAISVPWPKPVGWTEEESAQERT